MSVPSSDISSELTDLREFVRIIQHRLHLGSAESLAQAQRSETEAEGAPYVLSRKEEISDRRPLPNRT